MRDAPIGIFDSGIGGLTVARAVFERLPRESTIYYGDTARVPYGPKSPETVRRYSREILHWLLGEGVKAVVIACNTSTAHALEALQAESPVPVIGVIDPGARAAVASAGAAPVGVIGTAGTIASGAYDRAIRRLAPDARVVQQPCPLFVPLVEEGWTQGEVARLVAHEYLDPIRDEGIDALVLGCTHYPLLKPLLREIVGAQVRLIDSAEETAAETARLLDTLGLRAAPDAVAAYRFIASDAPEQFLRLGQRFLGESIDRVETLTLG
jgi:glutamate racemase